eukprot:4151080-Amphidinium_carterae.1
MDCSAFSSLRLFQFLTVVVVDTLAFHALGVTRLLRFRCMLVCAVTSGALQCRKDVSNFKSPIDNKQLKENA